MKVNLVKDANGKVVATFENAVAGGPSIKPVLKPGHKVTRSMPRRITRRTSKPFTSTTAANIRLSEPSACGGPDRADLPCGCVQRPGG